MNKITFVLGLGVFGVICTEFGVIGILPHLARHFQIGIEKAGLLISLFSLIIAISGIFITLFTSKFNKRYVLLFSLFVFVVSNVLSALATSFEWLLFARLIPAFFVPIYFSTALVTATETTKASKSTEAVAAIYAGISVATVLGIPMINYLADTFSWRFSFWFTAAVNILAWGSLFKAIPSMPVSKKISVGNQIRILKRIPLWLSMLGVCLLAAGSFSVYSYFAEYLLQVFHMNHHQVSFMLILFGATSVAGNWMAGIALGKSFDNTLLFFIAGISLTMLLMKFVGIHFEIQVILIAVWGFLHAAGFVITQVWVSMESAEAAAFGNGLLISTANFGVAIGTTLGGFVIDQYGIHHLVWAGLVLFLLTLITFRVKQILFSRSYSTQSDIHHPGSKKYERKKKDHCMY